MDKTVWLGVESQGCGRCVPVAGARICAAEYGRAIEGPALDGDPLALQRVLQALRDVADDGGNLVDRRYISALRIADGEVELTLAGSAACGTTQMLAEDAFQVLRRLLPDTDVYVRHAG